MKNTAFLLLAFIALQLSACKKSDTSTPIIEAPETEAVTDTLKQLGNDTLSPLESIRADVEYINNSGRSLSKKSYTYPCDETIKIDYYYNTTTIFKAVVDYGTVGDHYQRKEFYYRDGKLIFFYDITEGGPACEGCEMKLEKRWYLDNESVIKYSEDNETMPCEVCSFPDKSLPYSILKGFKTGDFTGILCK